MLRVNTANILYLLKIKNKTYRLMVAKDKLLAIHN